MTHFLQFNLSLSSVLNLVSRYTSWYWQPFLLLDSAERSFDICSNPSYSDVCQFKDSARVFLELVGQFGEWCVAAWEIWVHEWIQISILCLAAKRCLWKRCVRWIPLLSWEKKRWQNFKTEIFIWPSSCRQGELRY